MTSAIRAEALSKRYLLGGRAPTLRDAFRLSRPPAREHWALRDVSFDVGAGDVVAVVGRNGAGKSTLLKLLSRVVDPTSGRAEIRGRVASLLEVGTGFHPELTGRENAILNGVLLGMTRKQVRRLLDEIVAYAGVEAFVDEPVRHYSSGMQVRLAFSVAAHLDAEIVIVDEVLSVGDAVFQKKSAEKMGAIAKSGRTVLLVSHDLAAVEQLATRAILLDKGSVRADGGVHDILRSYRALLAEQAGVPLGERTDRSGNGRARVTALRVVGDARCGADVVFELDVDCAVAVREPRITVAAYDALRRSVAYFGNGITGDELPLPAGRSTLRLTVPHFPLLPDSYTFNVHVEEFGAVADWVEDAAVIDVVAGPFFASHRLPPRSHAQLAVDHRWSRAS